jgi:hypothetical protein
MKFGIDTLDNKSFLSFYITYSSPTPFEAVLFFVYNSLTMRYVSLAVVTNQLPWSRESLEHLKMTTI